MSIHDFLKKRSPWGLYAISLALLALLYTMNMLSPRELSFSLFYLGPIGMVAWYLGFWRGVSIAVLSTIAWYITEAQSGALYSVASFAYWNAFVRLIFFIIIVYLLSTLHQRLLEQQRLADTDSLTSALNTRGFMQRVEAELERARRYNYACSLAYIDLDNFKAMNDKFGHATGDELLRELVEIMREHTRASDIVGRIGGDEFAIFYTETDGDAAMKAIRKLRLHVKDRMARSQWPVTLSVGVVTVDEGDCTLAALLKEADDLMYQVKGDGKNSARNRHFSGGGAT